MFKSKPAWLEWFLLVSWRKHKDIKFWAMGKARYLQVFHVPPACIATADSRKAKHPSRSYPLSLKNQTKISKTPSTHLWHSKNFPSTSTHTMCFQALKSLLQPFSALLQQRQHHSLAAFAPPAARLLTSRARLARRAGLLGLGRILGVHEGPTESIASQRSLWRILFRMKALEKTVWSVPALLVGLPNSVWCTYILKKGRSLLTGSKSPDPGPSLRIGPDQAHHRSSTAGLAIQPKSS